MPNPNFPDRIKHWLVRPDGSEVLYQDEIVNPFCGYNPCLPPLNEGCYWRRETLQQTPCKPSSWKVVEEICFDRNGPREPDASPCHIV